MHRTTDVEAGSVGSVMRLLTLSCIVILYPISTILETETKAL